MKRALLVMGLVIGVALMAHAGALERFIENYGHGNLHTLIFTVTSSQVVYW